MSSKNPQLQSKLSQIEELLTRKLDSGTVDRLRRERERINQLIKG